MKCIPGEKAIIVAANYGYGGDLELDIQIPLIEMKLNDNDKYQVEDLWNNKTQIMDKDELNKFKVVIPPYGHKGGGISVTKITPLEK